MARYTTQEMAINPNEDGSRKQRYTLLVGEHLSHEQFVATVAEHSGMLKADLNRALGIVAEKLPLILAQGNSVTIDGIGTFRAGIGEKKTRKFDFKRGKVEAPADKRTYSANLQIDRINFKADQGLIREARSHCELSLDHPVTDSLPLSQITTTREERLKMLRAYLKEKKYMRLSDYKTMTSLSKTSAQREMKEFVRDETSGITSDGSGPSKVFILKEGFEEK